MGEVRRRGAVLWSESSPGLVMAACGVTEGAFEVHRRTGVSLRVASEAYLCFDCGPGGGVYHPEDGGGQANDMSSVAIIASELDDHHNRFEVHEHMDARGGVHPLVSHSHTDGDDVHRHPDKGWAAFTETTEQRWAVGFPGTGQDPKFTPQPTGPDLPFVAPTEEERVFLVVGPHVYVNPAENGSGVMGGAKLTARQRAAQKPPPEWGRAAWRASMDLYVEAIRRQRAGLPATLVGPSAVLMTANRMQLRFRLTPVYSIQGWTPTLWLGLP